MARISFIGLGNMGGPMASNLLQAGHQVIVFDLSADAVNALKARGGAGVNQRLLKLRELTA